VGVPGSITSAVAARVEKQFGVKRSQFFINASHTHTGPVVWSNLNNLTVFPPDEQVKLETYARRFTDDLVTAIGAAVRDLSPATVEYGEGTAGFAINRRRIATTGVTIGVNPSGPIDHTVPVIKVTDGQGKLRALLFGYACHNTTLTGEIYQLSGDYAGFAAAELEREHPGTTALFLQLCGADQNPNPRGTVELGQKHGAELAAAVDRVIAGSLKPLTGPIRAAYRTTELRLAPRTRADLEAELKVPLAAQVRRAQMMLQLVDAGKRIDRVDYPVQAVRLGSGLTLVALGGEVVLDYAIRMKREFPGEPLVVAGYSNDVMCYIPSKRVLGEGGYEAVDSMIYYGQAGPFMDDVEERIFMAVRRTMKDVGR
jgi:hypothetical protein